MLKRVDEKNNVFYYKSIEKAADRGGVTVDEILKAIKENSLLNGSRYIFEKERFKIEELGFKWGDFTYYTEGGTKCKRSGFLYPLKANYLIANESRNGYRISHITFFFGDKIQVIKLGEVENEKNLREILANYI